MDGIEANNTPACLPDDDGLGVLPPVGVALTDDVYEQAVSTLARIVAAWWNGRQAPVERL